MTGQETSRAQSDSNTAEMPNAAAKTESAAAVPRKRGFGAMDRAEVRKLAQKGGVAAHRAGTAHEFSSEEARAAGRKGGLATHSGRIEQAKDIAKPATESSNKIS